MDSAYASTDVSEHCCHICLMATWALDMLLYGSCILKSIREEAKINDLGEISMFCHVDGTAHWV